MDSVGVVVISVNKVHNNLYSIVIECHTGTYKIIRKPGSIEWRV